MSQPAPLRAQLSLFVALVVFLTLLGLAARLGLVLFFGLAQDASADDWMQALLIGLRFDLRIAIICLLPILVLGWLPWIGGWWQATPGLRSRRIIGTYWLLVSTAWVLAAAFDFGYYAYLSTRLSAYALMLARDTGDALRMIWQSYPVVWLLLALVALLALMHAAFVAIWNRLIETDRSPPAAEGRFRRYAVRAVIVVACLALIHGRWSQYPLRWSDSQRIHTPAMRAAALNPMQNLVDTWRFSRHRYDESTITRDLDLVRRELGIDSISAHPPAPLLRCIPDRRTQLLDGSRPRPVNVVLIFMESFSAHKAGAFGNPLGATPNFDRMAAQGLLFTRAFAAHMGTARGIFATLSGIPDFSPESTASRDPDAVEQHLIANDLVEHDRFYFIGGSTSWANVRGFLGNGIDRLRFVEEADMRQGRADVWGVPDHELFREANRILSQQHRPFFAVIQTASNHKPYTIPGDAAAAMPTLPATQAQALEYGFTDGLEELRSLQYLDWSLGQFMESASAAPYYQDTLFVLIGDHGMSTPAGPHMPALWSQWRLTQGHTPLLFFAPRSLPPARDDRWAMQVDVMPTIAGLLGVPYRNTTMGQDLLRAGPSAAHAIGHGFAEPWDRLWMHGDWVYRQEPGGREQVRHWKSGEPADANAASDPRAPAMRDAWFNVARYLTTHNRRLPAMDDLAGCH